MARTQRELNGHPNGTMPDTEQHVETKPHTLDLSFVVIGYNEEATLGSCLESVRACRLSGVSHELIYVDGGSQDNSLQIAAEVGVDQCLGGDKRRRAAENRNLGFKAARGRLVQFVDGDMTLMPDWPKTAMALLHERPRVAAVCGNLDETSPGSVFNALQIDWMPREGVIRHCGGAAMYRRNVLERLDGFPEDVTYGEEPYLCWRIRNELKQSIYQINRTMAKHDLGYAGWGDYWRRALRCGATYAEIAARCYGTADPLWLKEAITNPIWAGAILCAAVLLIIGPMWVRAAVVAAAAWILARKFHQLFRQGYSWRVSALYALHTYTVKIPLAAGECVWIVRLLAGKR